MISPLLYSWQICIYQDLQSLEAVQFKFLWSIQQAPQNASTFVAFDIWTSFSCAYMKLCHVQFWSKLIFNERFFASLTLLDSNQSSWEKGIELDLRNYGLLTQYMVSLRFEGTCSAVLPFMLLLKIHTLLMVIALTCQRRRKCSSELIVQGFQLAQ